MFRFWPFFREISIGSSRERGGRISREQEIIELGRKIDQTYVVFSSTWFDEPSSKSKARTVRTPDFDRDHNYSSDYLLENEIVGSQFESVIHSAVKRMTMSSKTDPGKNFDSKFSNQWECLTQLTNQRTGYIFKIYFRRRRDF